MNASRNSICAGRGLAIAVAVAALASSLPQPVFAQQPVAIVAVNVKAVDEGFRASKLIGDGVVNDKGEKIGDIDDIVVGHNGQLFAVLQVGGFLGLGGHRIAVPFNSLVFNQKKHEIELPGATKEALRRLPEIKFPS